MTEYVLQLSKWACGYFQQQYDPNLDLNQVYGLGGTLDTLMLNEEGYMCCLGQFAKQAGVCDEYLLGAIGPSVVAQKLDKNQLRADYDPNFVNEFGKQTQLTKMLMTINDNSDSSVNEKIDQIRNQLKKYGHSLKVIQ